MSRTSAALAFSLLVSFGTAHAQGQFDPPSATDPFARDNVQAEIVNYETPLIKPILLTRDGLFVIAANEPENRIAVYETQNFGSSDIPFAEVVVGQGITALVERPGANEIWVSCRFQSSVVVVNRDTWTVTHVLRPPLAGNGTGMGDAGEPGGMTFTTDGALAYVAASATDRLIVFDAVSKQYVEAIDLEGWWNHAKVSPREPRAVLNAGGFIVAASWKSGNNTLAIPHDFLDFSDPANPVKFGFSGLIINAGLLSPPALQPTEDKQEGPPPKPQIGLPDFDAFAVAPGTNQVSFVRDGIGTLIFGAAHDPNENLVAFTNTEALNGYFLGENAFPDGKVVLNRLTFVHGASGALDHFVDLGEASMPTDVVFDADGRVYVAAYTGAKIAVYEPHAGGGSTSNPLKKFTGHSDFWGAIPTNAGPRGLAIGEVRGRTMLYCLNRIAGTIQAFDVTNIASGSVPVAASGDVTLANAEFDRVKQGREIFNDSSQSAGTTSCASCHPDLSADGIGWDLSKFDDKHDPSLPDLSIFFPPEYWQDRKKSMVTQDLRSLEEIPPYHWRGEQADLEAFNDAFEGLLHGSKLSDPDFALMKDYVFSARYPANPHQQMNREFTAMGDAGLTTFQNSCEGCHALPTGSDGRITDLFPVGAFPNGQDTDHLTAIKTTQMRGMWTKLSDLVRTLPTQEDPMFPITGFGLAHEGNARSQLFFVQEFFGFTPQEDREVEQFMREFDSGLAPSANYSEALNRATTQTNRIESFMIPQADRGWCDVVAHGRLKVTPDGPWVRLGLYYDRSIAAGPAFTASRSTIGPFTLQELVDRAARDEAELLFLGVPLWSGERVGIDRDRDGLRDDDEARVSAVAPIDPDRDGDGRWDGEDGAPDNGAVQVAPGGVVPIAPQVTSFSSTALIRTSRTLKFVYETDRLSPTRLLFRPNGTNDPFQAVGDPWPPLDAQGHPINNHWKRKHTAIARILLPRTEYELAIETMGQNGVGQTFPIGVHKTIDNENGTLGENLRFNFSIDEMTVIGQNLDGNGMPQEFRVDLRLTDDRNRPLEATDLSAPSGEYLKHFLAHVNFVATHFDASGEVLGREDVLSATFLPAGHPVLADGRLLVVWAHPFGLQPGEKVQITIPMAVGPLDPAGKVFAAGIQLDHDTVGPVQFLSNFAWSERREFVQVVDL